MLPRLLLPLLPEELLELLELELDLDLETDEELEEEVLIV